MTRYAYYGNYNSSLVNRAQAVRGGGGGLPFSKIGKKRPNLEKKCTDCGHLWVKIRNYRIFNFFFWRRLKNFFNEKW